MNIVTAILAAIPGVAAILSLADKWFGSKKAAQLKDNIETRNKLKDALDQAIASSKKDYAESLRKALKGE